MTNEAADKAVPTELPLQAGLRDPLSETFPHTTEGRLLFWIAVAFSTFQVATASQRAGKGL